MGTHARKNDSGDAEWQQVVKWSSWRWRRGVPGNPAIELFTLVFF
jgi:hypothetical protein